MQAYKMCSSTEEHTPIAGEAYQVCRKLVYGVLKLMKG